MSRDEKGSSNSGGGSNDGGHLSGLPNKVVNAGLNALDKITALPSKLTNKNKNKDDGTDTKCKIVEGWECPRFGKHAHPIDCQKYVKCSFKGDNEVFECDDDEAFDPKNRQCTTDWSTCEALEQCLYHRQLIEDPSDDNGYFICIKNNNKFKESFTVARRSCSNFRKFDKDYQLCMDSGDANRIKKAKRRREQIRKAKKCAKRKGNNKASNSKKKKTPSRKN